MVQELNITLNEVAARSLNDVSPIILDHDGHRLAPDNGNIPVFHLTLAFGVMAITPVMMSEIQKICKNSYHHFRGYKFYSFTSDDLFQTVVTRLWDSQSKVKAKTQKELYGWVKRVARNACIDQFRHLDMCERVHELFLGMDLKEPVGSLSLEQHILLEQIMSTISEKQKEVLRLRFIEELSLSETAAQMGLSENQAKYILKKALKTLRMKLEAGAAPGARTNPDGAAPTGNTAIDGTADATAKGAPTGADTIDGAAASAPTAILSLTSKISGAETCAVQSMYRLSVLLGDAPVQVIALCEEHLSECQACRDEFREIRRIILALRKSPSKFFPEYKPVIGSTMIQ